MDEKIDLSSTKCTKSQNPALLFVIDRATSHRRRRSHDARALEDVIADARS
jgi:hypothetical protein